MNRAYMITNCIIDTDIYLGYLIEKREIYFSKIDLIRYIKELIELFYEEYIEKTNTDLSFDDFYNKFYLDIEVKSVSLQKNYIKDENDYYTFLSKVKQYISKDNLEEFLLSYTDICEFHYDHNLNLKETYTSILTGYKQFSFSYKALFPEKYHVEKYKDGDRVKYDNEEYIIKTNNKEESIYDSNNPLDYLWGYSLFTDDGYFIQDDKWCYFVVDEDLDPLPLVSKETTKEQIDSICEFIFDNKSSSISNISKNFKYDKLIRSDEYLSVVLNTTDGKNIEIDKKSSMDLLSYTFFNNEVIVSYIIGFIEILDDCIIDNICVKYNDKIIDTISINKKYIKGDRINISRYI